MESLGGAFRLDPGSSWATPKIRAVAFGKGAQFVRRSAATWPLEAASAAQGRAGARPANPDEAVKAARARVQRLETALAALGESDSVEARALQSALKSAQRASEDKPVDVQVKGFEAFIGRSQNRLANLEKECAKEQDMLDAAAARLARLRELASTGVPTQPPPFVPPASDLEAEIKRLREHVAELEGTSTTQERPRVRPRVSGAAGGGFHPINAKFDPCRALPLDRRSSDRSSGGARRWEFGTSARIDVEDGGRGRTVEGDRMQPNGPMRLVLPSNCPPVWVVGLPCG